MDHKRLTLFAGHYGSGKTELAVSLALSLAKQQEKAYPRLALVDLDVANPYFRSREQQELLRAHGVQVYSDTFGGSMTAELPALTAALVIGTGNNFTCSRDTKFFCNSR